MQGNQHSEKSCLCVKKEETKKTPTEPSLFVYLLFLLLHILTPVRENEEARLVRRFDARCYGGCAQTHSFQRVRPRRRLSRKCISLSLSFGKRRIKLYSRVWTLFLEPRTFFVSLFLCVFIISLSNERRARKRKRERERFTRVLGPSLDGGCVISYERKSARARVLSHSGSFLGE